MAQIAENLVEACREIAKTIAERRVRSSSEVELIKINICKRFGLAKIPSNSEILRYAEAWTRGLVEDALRKKPSRTISGVSVITVVAPPAACPHGSCVYCPGGPEFATPKSYTGSEPAVLQGREVDYDPHLQVSRKVRQLEEMGHKVDKVELIIIGGTFNALPKQFQRNFIKRCLDALNATESSSLEEALKIAETAPRRVSGITIETKPDWAKLGHLNEMLEMGVTRVELGVQALDDWIYDLVNRGHKLSDVVEATRSLRNLAFKINYHVMPGLPGSSYEKDLAMFEELFTNPAYRPDMLKIYPTLVLPGTQLYKWWLRGWYRPYDTEELVELLVECLRRVPPYVRIQRIQREIPAGSIASGNKVGNLRELVESEMRRRGHPCRCIRCREVARRALEGKIPDQRAIRLCRITYEAAGGLEYFLSFEDVENDILIGFLRLRLPSEEPRLELRGAALVRELHVYGRMVPVGMEPKGSWQHAGFGSKLLAEAERIALEELDRRRVVVISGVGVRQYYAARGYKLEGPYMVKDLT